MHIMVIEYARHVLGCSDPNSSEFVPDTCYPVIDFLPEQREIEDKGGTMRLGRYECVPVADTLTAKAYNGARVHERHRHRYEFNNEFKDILVNGGLIVGAMSPDGKLVEVTEVAGHPWMVGTQAHPEFRSRPYRPHPLFVDFIGAVKDTLREGSQHSFI